jgi:multimeric flavodoxin WrbA
MKILVITSNPGKKGALASLTDEAARGASEAGAEVEQIRLADSNIGYCRFCMTCFKDETSPIGRCVQDDDMRSILEKLKEADGYVMASPVSSGHANALFKTFFERCCYTAGRPGKLLWLKGPPEPRFTDKQRFTVTIVSSGSIPTWLKAFCNTATKEMAELSKCALNSKVIGSEYAGNLIYGGFKSGYSDKAYELGRLLAERIAAA